MTQDDGMKLEDTITSVDGHEGAGNSAAAEPVDANELVANLLGWREELMDTVEQMPMDGFERLILLLLGKDGVSDIDVSHTTDTVEGMGIFGGGGFLSFRVLFRCIRGGGRISSAVVEDFRRGVMLGRADKGLLITTGKFTQEAELKSASERVPEIRLIDGTELIEKLKALGLGVRTEPVLVERVIIDGAWFGGL